MDKRWTWFFLILVTLIGAALFTKGVWPLDEIRYAEVGREVLSQDSVFLLTKNAEPYSHKPPLYPWLMAIGYTIFGVQDWIPKIIPMLFSLGTVWAGGLVYRDLYSQAVPGLYKVVLLSAVYYFIFSFYSMFDVQLTFWALLAIHFYLVRRYRWYWVMLGLGILTKGPVILVVAGLPVLVDLIQQRGWKSLKPGLEFWLGFAIMLAVVGIWLVPLILSTEANFIHELVIRQNFGRVTGAESWSHQRPIYWYLYQYPALAAPWALIWYVNAFSRRFRQGKGDRFVNTFILTNLIAFSFISGKQLQYLIPTIPFLAIWISRHQAELFRTKPTKIVAKVYAIVLFGFGVASIWFGGGIHDYWRLPSSIMQDIQELPPLVNPHSLISVAWFPVGWSLLLAGIYGLIRKMNGPRRLTWLVAGMVLMFSWLSLVFIPTADPLMNPKALSEEIAQLHHQGATVGIYNPGTYHANFNFYAGIDHFPIVQSVEEAQAFLGRPEKQLLVVPKGNSLLNNSHIEVLTEGWNRGDLHYVIRRKF